MGGTLTLSESLAEPRKDVDSMPLLGSEFFAIRAGHAGAGLKTQKRFVRTDMHEGFSW